MIQIMMLAVGSGSDEEGHNPDHDASCLIRIWQEKSFHILKNICKSGSGSNMQPVESRSGEQ
jgi:hypothetical protein